MKMGGSNAWIHRIWWRAFGASMLGQSLGQGLIQGILQKKQEKRSINDRFPWNVKGIGDKPFDYKGIRGHIFICHLRKRRSGGKSLILKNEQMMPQIEL